MAARAKGVRVEGLAELRRNLKKLDEGARKEVRGAITTTVRIIRDKARSRVRVRTGAGQKAIRGTVSKNGTRGRVTHPKRLFYLRFLETGTRRQKAQPWLFPAAEEEREPHVQRMREAVERAASQARTA